MFFWDSVARAAVVMLPDASRRRGVRGPTGSIPAKYAASTTHKSCKEDRGWLAFWFRRDHVNEATGWFRAGDGGALYGREMELPDIFAALQGGEKKRGNSVEPFLQAVSRSRVRTACA